MSDVRGFVVSICRFCGLNVNRPVPVSTTGHVKLNSVLSRITGRFPRSTSARRSSRVPEVTVIKGPGMKGSSLMGGLLKRSHIVISSVTKAAESTMSAEMG